MTIRSEIAVFVPSPLRLVMKQLPLIGRIQEGLGTDTRSPVPAQADPKVQGQADWLLESIRRTADHFHALAERSGLRAIDDGSSSNHREADARRVSALLLAYKLNLTASRRREDNDPGAAALRIVRAGMIRELKNRVDNDPDAISRSHLDAADLDIAASIIRFEAGLPGPLTPFYGDLAPAFGGPCPASELANRFGKIVRHLYEHLLKKLDERDRSRDTHAFHRYASSGR